MPAPSLFPFDTITSSSPKPDRFPLSSTAQPSSMASSWSWLWSLFSRSKTDSFDFSVPKWASGPTAIQLSSALQYSSAGGLAPLARFVQDFSRIVYQPAYDGFATVVSTGCTDAWVRV